VPSLSPVTATITRQAPVSYFSFVAWIFRNRLALNNSCVLYITALSNYRNTLFELLRDVQYVPNVMLIICGIPIVNCL
jgi:hypothetical protein